MFRLSFRTIWYLLGFALLGLAAVTSCGCAPGASWDFDPVPDEQPVHQPAGTKLVTASWTPPCLGPEPPCGGPWTHYVLETRRARGDWAFRLATEDTFARFPLQPGTWYARVAAVNDTIQGPYSEPSDPLTIPAPDDDKPDLQEYPIGEERR